MLKSILQNCFKESRKTVCDSNQRDGCTPDRKSDDAMEYRNLQ